MMPFFCRPFVSLYKRLQEVAILLSQFGTFRNALLLTWQIGVEFNILFGCEWCARGLGRNKGFHYKYCILGILQNLCMITGFKDYVWNSKILVKSSCNPFFARMMTRYSPWQWGWNIVIFTHSFWSISSWFSTTDFSQRCHLPGAKQYPVSHQR